MEDKCFLCLNDISEKSFFQKILQKENKKCNCNYKIHNICMFKYMYYCLDNIEDVKCIICKEIYINREKFMIINPRGVKIYFIFFLNCYLMYRTFYAIFYSFYVIIYYFCYKIHQNVAN